jgi:hypothetical protein
MKNRYFEVLINPTENEMLEKEPLLAFSFYLSERNNILLLLADEIVDNLDVGFSTSPVNIELIGKASTSMWFWTLGAYEVIRTISQAKDCFSNEFIEKVNTLKKKLAIVRMPSAKMEEQGNNKKAVTSNRSPDGWDMDKKDLLVGSPHNPISARYILQLYKDTIYSLTTTDIKKHHAESSMYL